jgi:hypothetical protein
LLTSSERSIGFPVHDPVFCITSARGAPPSTAHVLESGKEKVWVRQ